MEAKCFKNTSLIYNLVVERDHSGPRLDGELSMEFVKELISTFKDQKKLHIRYAYKVYK